MLLTRLKTHALLPITWHMRFKIHSKGRIAIMTINVLLSIVLGTILESVIDSIGADLRLNSGRS